MGDDRLCDVEMGSKSERNSETVVQTMIQRTWTEQHLIPNAWRDRFSAHGWSVFNNAIVRHRGELLMCYRVIAPSSARWLAMCRLTAEIGRAHV